MWSSWTDALRAYARTRFAPERWVPVAVLLAAPGVVHDGASALAAALRVGLALVLLAQLRLWDDLADVAHDRAAHPERVLCRVAALAPFRLALGALTAVGPVLLAALRRSPCDALALVALDLALVAWYGPARARVRSPVVRALVPLAKYPGIALLLHGPPRPGGAAALAAAALSIQATFMMFELLHDDALAARASALPRLAAVAMFAAGALLAARFGPPSARGAVGPLRGGASMVALGIFAVIGTTPLPKRSSARLRLGYLAFGAGLAGSVAMWAP